MASQMPAHDTGPLPIELVEALLGQDVLQPVDTIAGGVAALRIKAGSAITLRLLLRLGEELEATA